ncbi:hypothetical protein DS745_00790 [Anaerobacillus alkaliphilus]|uniref:Amidohydrolase-related domain-containing protein n=1 Tax=Anaerobacillus alkaliphilus TaxID=1548597 RepID=A0A4Q0VWV2_9BACI|nr:hypothetical protein [Anaerobacillus alkaliphilus]RXJ03959.1 hypothetical protein DS745_00790 [Anaerobacillus alkaliphilus]
MRYIIENTLTNRYGEEKINSYLIEGSKIIYTSNRFSKHNHMRLDTSNYVIAPGHIMIDFSVVAINDFHSIKERMRHLQGLGCTTLITACEVHHENEVKSNLKRVKHALINSSIDYMIGIRTPLKKLTPSLARKCCKHKVPVIFTEITEPEDIDVVPWQWVRNELFPYHPMILPIWNVPNSSGRLRRLKSKWEEILTENKITTLVDVPDEHTPLQKEFLLNIGLYPIKGSLHIGADADYLLFSQKALEEAEKGTIDEVRPEIVYASGTVKKAGRHIFIKPGSGKELTVNVPRKLVPISNAFQPSPIPIDYY